MTRRVPSPTPTRWIVISLDAFATSAISAYGSSWNSTPALDTLASGAMLWDRVIATSDDAAETLKACWRGETAGGRWIDAFRAVGPTAWISDAGEEAAEIAGQAGFDHCTVVIPPAADDSAGDRLPANEIEETRLARLFAATLERLDAPHAEWSLLWVHSAALAAQWDAPRWLFPVEELDDEVFEPVDPANFTGDPWDSPSAAADGDAVAPPPIWDSVDAPSHRLSGEEHPDWVTSWMQTYGCQVQLVDRLLRLLLESLATREESIGLAVLGIGGISLGQNGWIGHRVGPLRSPQIHVPAILWDRGSVSMRIPGLTSLPEVVACIQPVTQRVAPIAWASDAAEKSVVTRSSRAKAAVTTQEWFWVVGPDNRSSLFLKPDDREDSNDVSSRCQEVVRRFEADHRDESREATST